jgi:FtsZ-binding cell division protein ZapB
MPYAYDADSRIIFRNGIAACDCDSDEDVAGFVEEVQGIRDTATVTQLELAAVKAQRDELLAACERAEQALVKMHAQRLWNEHASWDSAQAEARANECPLPEVSQLRAAINRAKGEPAP